MINKETIKKDIIYLKEYIEELKEEVKKMDKDRSNLWERHWKNETLVEGLMKYLDIEYIECDPVHAMRKKKNKIIT